MVKDNTESCASHNRRVKVWNTSLNCRKFHCTVAVGYEILPKYKEDREDKQNTFIWSYSVGECRWKIPLGDFSRKCPHMIEYLFLCHSSPRPSPRKWQVLFQHCWGQSPKYLIPNAISVQSPCSDLSLSLLTYSIQLRVMSPLYRPSFFF